MTVGEKISLLRKKRGLTQFQVAEKLDVSRQAISKWESGSAVPSIDNLKNLGRLYGVSVDNLLNEDGSIECLGYEETVAESPTEQQRGRKKCGRTIIIIIVCILASIVAGALIYGKVSAGKSHKFNFEEMERDNWETNEINEFTIDW